MLLSLTPVARLRYAGATPVGTFLLYVVYAAVGARADLRGVASAPVFLLAGALILVFHAGVMLVTARLLRPPAFLTVTASQANVGGMATAPIVAALYQPALSGGGAAGAVGVGVRRLRRSGGGGGLRLMV